MSRGVVTGATSLTRACVRVAAQVADLTDLVAPLTGVCGDSYIEALVALFRRG
jgi:hypothetical protein